MNARLVYAFLLCLYLLTGGGKGYSVDGAFGYEMAKTVFLDPSHDYFRRFKTAFARWGALMPLLGQPFVLAGDALSRAAPERDALVVAGHTFRVEEWPAVAAGEAAAQVPVPEPGTGSASVLAVALISYLADAADVPQGAVVGEVRLWSGDRRVALPVRAGIETAEWAHDRPDVAPLMRHARAPIAGHWIGQPRGNLYYARLALDGATPIDRWELAPGPGLPPGATWQVRAAALQTGAGWTDAHTGQRFWSARQTRDFFTHLVYSTVNAFTTAAAAALVFLIARRLGYRAAVAAAVALGYGAATMAWPYAKLDFSEPASTAFTLLAVWALLTAFADGALAPRPAGPAPLTPGPSPTRGEGRGTVDMAPICPSPRAGSPLPSLGEGPGVRARPSLGEETEVRVHNPIALGLLASISLLLAIAGKYTAALGAGAVLAQWAVSSGWWRPETRGRALRFLAALVLPALVLGLVAGATAYRLTGERPIVLTSGTSRLREDWLALPLWTGLRGLVFSPGKSVFLYSPWLLLAVPGAVWLVRRRRRESLLFVVYPILTVLLYSMKLVFHGGSWGPRYLVPVLPFLAIAAAPAVSWCLDGGRRWRAALAALAAVSVVVQLVGIGKDPEQFPSMVREFVVPGQPDDGSQLGGRDYWLARGGPGLSRALADPQPGSTGRGLGYVWGLPTAQILVPVREPGTFSLALYFVDWDQQHRRQVVTVEDALGTRTLVLGSDFGDGVWARWQVTVDPQRPLRIGLQQTGGDTAVVSAAAFDPATGERSDAAVLDRQTRGNWQGMYGASGYALFAWRSFNVDLAALPPWVGLLDVTHTGDNPNPRIHVEIAEQDVRDTPLLYAAPFSPLLGNAWLEVADLSHLLLPSRPGVTAALLSRPPWRFFGVDAPGIPHPEYGLGLDFWPTLLYTAYASHGAVLAATWAVLLALEAALCTAAFGLLRCAGAGRLALPLLAALSALLLLYDWLQFRA